MLRAFTPNQMWCQGDLISLCPTFLDSVVSLLVDKPNLIIFKILTTYHIHKIFRTLTLTLTKVSMESIESLSQVIVFINLDVNITRGPGRVTIPISLLQLKGKNDYIGHISCFYKWIYTERCFLLCNCD